MTLPASGSISLSQVNSELGLAATANIALVSVPVRNLAGVPSGTISMSNLRGKSSVTFVAAGTSSNSSYSTINAGGTAQATPYVTVSNGSGSYTYAWSTVSSIGLAATLANTTSAQCSLTRTYSKLSDGSFDYTMQCIVTDTVSGKTVTVSNIHAKADWFSNR